MNRILLLLAVSRKIRVSKPYDTVSKPYDTVNKLYDTVNKPYDTVSIRLINRLLAVSYG